MFCESLECIFVMRFTDDTNMASVWLCGKKLGTIDETGVVVDTVTCKARSHVCM